MPRLLAALLAAAVFLVAAAPAAAERVLTVDLLAGDGSAASGRVDVFVRTNRSDDGVRPRFALRARGLRPNAAGEAYAVWLQGGRKPHLLGFAPRVGRDGRLQVAGPPGGRELQFLRWLDGAGELLVTRERTDAPRTPGPAALRGLVGDIDLP